jgi:two-component sensor histidine kinase
MPTESQPQGMDQLLETPDLAVALESDRFKQFLDRVPIAVAVSELSPIERVIYANLEFERLSGQLNTAVLGNGWQSLPGEATAPQGPRSLGKAIVDGRDYLGSFNVPHGEASTTVNAWSNVIDDDDGKPAFRLVALIEAATHNAMFLDELAEQVREKDTQLLELQHRVKNNLQLITALIRVEARGVSDLSTGEGFDRLAGRVEALGLLYRALGDIRGEGVVDLGIYLSEIAAAVMRAHAWLVSLDVAMPTGLVVNELLTNTLKHAFKDRDGGCITLHSTTDDTGGCRLLVADDGVGLPEGYDWPKPGKLSALIVRSLLQNAKARMDVKSSAGRGLTVEITFSRSDAAEAS